MATNKPLNRVKWDFIILSISFILLGLLFLLYPEASGTIICYLLGSLFLLLGIMRVIAYITTPVVDNEFHIPLVSGIIIIAVGIFIFIWPSVLLSILPMVLGIVVVVDSLVKLQSATDLLRLGDKHWWIILILAIVTAFLGILMLINPFATAKLLLQFIGISLIVTGFMDLWSVFKLSRRLHKTRDRASVTAEGESIDVSAHNNDSGA